MNPTSAFLPIIFSAILYAFAAGLSLALLPASCVPEILNEPWKDAPEFLSLDELDWRFTFLSGTGNLAGADERPIQVPGYWHEQYPELPGAGFGVYRLKLNFAKTPSPARFDALRIHEISAAARIFWNGRGIGESGRWGMDRQSERGRLAPLLLGLAPGMIKKHNLLEIQVSNFHARGGGMQGLRLGRAADFRKQHLRRVMFESFFVGFYLCCALFFYLVFLNHRRDKTPLYFAGLLLCLGLRSFSSNSGLEILWPDKDFTDLRLLLEYLSAIAFGPPLCLLFLACFFFPPGRTPASIAWLTKFFTGPGIILGIFFILTGRANIYGFWQPWYVRLSLAPCILGGLFVLLKACAHRKKGALTALMIYCAPLCSVFQDGLKSIRGESETLYTPVGAALFVIAMGAMLSGRTFYTYRELYRLRPSLKRARLTPLGDIRRRLIIKRRARKRRGAASRKLTRTLSGILEKNRPVENRTLRKTLQETLCWTRGSEEGDLAPLHREEFGFTEPTRPLEYEPDEFDRDKSIDCRAHIEFLYSIGAGRQARAETRAIRAPTKQGWMYYVIGRFRD